MSHGKRRGASVTSAARAQSFSCVGRDILALGSGRNHGGNAITRACDEEVMRKT